MSVESCFAAKDVLGEGPVWHVDEQALYWVDIFSKCLQRWQPESGAYQRWVLPEEIGCFAFREQGGVVAALRSGFALFDPVTQELTPLMDPEAQLLTNRFNDGKCDKQGRFWAGSMTDNGAPNAALYRLDDRDTCVKVRSGVRISNGLGWSPDGSILYFTDTLTQRIVAFDFDVTQGSVSNEREFAIINDGFPDGLTVDAEGFVWSAIWDGWRVNRYAPDGRLVDEVELPVQRPTSCTFGGADMSVLFVTSARTDLSEQALAKQPQAGHVFKLTTRTRGVPEPKFAH